MDRREISRINVKFGKFFDPLIILLIFVILTVSVLSVRNLSPRTFSQEQRDAVLGVQENGKVSFDLVRGNHNYITTENLEEITENHFKYTTLIKKPPQGRISKPVIKLEGLQEETEIKIYLNYTNLNNSKISIFSESNNTSYILQQDRQNYSQKFVSNQKSDLLYLVLENSRPVFFNQYLEINFFLNP